MYPFELHVSSDAASAVRSGSRNGAKFIAGGTNLVDLMKANVEQPSHLIDINDLAMRGIERVGGGIRIGALERMSDVAAHPLIVQSLPAVSQSLLASASPQLRNAASIGGNMMQRPRCQYFRELLFTPCNKRNPGSGCSAIGGVNRTHAVLGVSDACIATHPSDFAVAASALDAMLVIRGANGERRIAATEFHRLPGRTPHLEHNLEHGELITALIFPDAPHARRSAYLKVRDRASYEFALTSAAVGLDLDSGLIRSVRIALGGVGTKPWRSREAEAVLSGKAATEANFRAAADAAVEGAVPFHDNAFKIDLAKRTLVRALADLAAGGAA